MYKHKRILHHVTQVISAVTYVVDILGDDTQIEKLNETLVALARAHVERDVSTAEFRDLGVVLLDFVCSFNCGQDSKAIISESDDAERSSKFMAEKLVSDTMTSALDRIRSSASSSYKDLDHILVQREVDTDEGLSQLSGQTERPKQINKKHEPSVRQKSCTLDHNHLVAAWTKLYNIILEVVQNEATKSGKS